MVTFIDEWPRKFPSCMVVKRLITRALTSIIQNTEHVFFCFTAYLTYVKARVWFMHWKWNTVAKKVPNKLNMTICTRGGGPRVVASTAAFHARVRGSVPGLGGFKETKMFLPHPRVKVSIVGSLCDREVACSASDRQGSNFESCVWRTVSSHSSHHPQEVLLAQFNLYVHKGGLKPDLFHLFICTRCSF